ncbi:hypothetical protein BD311DRAFT_768662 [Dichomitus squalens]|uniref:Uncharacterized protein n=1 Tax=Dichomitus squalens TaxID=114155 RepID=A0A4Q9MC92_9APHY|nr:hypothetical protein BD311DRAFT_768662 [Dichomitus squalens]
MSTAARRIYVSCWWSANRSGAVALGDNRERSSRHHRNYKLQRAAKLPMPRLAQYDRGRKAKLNLRDILQKLQGAGPPRSA